jgi:hypothetical protein
MSLKPPPPDITRSNFEKLVQIAVYEQEIRAIERLKAARPAAIQAYDEQIKQVRLAQIRLTQQIDPDVKADEFGEPQKKTVQEKLTMEADEYEKQAKLWEAQEEQAAAKAEGNGKSPSANYKKIAAELRRYAGLLQ